MIQVKLALPSFTWASNQSSETFALRLFQIWTVDAPFVNHRIKANPILDKWLWLAREEPGRVEICLKKKLPKQIKNMSSAHSSGSRANQRELAARL